MMRVGPEGLEEGKFAFLRLDEHFLERKFGFATRTRHIVEILEGHELSLAEGTGATINMPVVVPSPGRQRCTL